MSSFFTVPASQRKRKRAENPPAANSKKSKKSRNSSTSQAQKGKRTRTHDHSPSISGSDLEDDEDERPRLDEEEEYSSGEEDETAADRRRRLAERYLKGLEEEVRRDEAGFDAEEIDRELISQRLKEDVAETKGKLYRFIASELDFSQASHAKFRSDKYSLTGVAACLPYAYTVTKGSTVTKWELAPPPHLTASADGTPTPTNVTRRTKPTLLARATNRGQGHTHASPILCVAVSDSNKFLATGDKKGTIVIWSVEGREELRSLHTFSQHRASVSGLSFRRGTHTLFSASADRTIKLFSLDGLAYMQTLYGHQDTVVDIAGLGIERCVSVGSRDRTARYWKVAEESQAVYRGEDPKSAKSSKSKSKSQADGPADTSLAEGHYTEGSMDRVAVIDDETFVTGSDNGSLCLWAVHKKKPVFALPLAHGLDPPLDLEESYPDEALDDKKIPSPRQPRWITALKTVPLADLIVSASWDGWIRAWRVTEDRKRIERVGVVGRVGDGADDGVTSETGNDKDDEPKPNGVAEGPFKATGYVNDIAVVERGDRGRDGLCIVAVLAKEHRLGNWGTKRREERNTAVVFEVPRKEQGVEESSASSEAPDEDEDENDDGFEGFGSE